MAKQREEEVKEGLPAWMGTYGDMVTLLLCFFVLLFSMSSVDVRKFKEAIASFNNQIDVLPGGEALTEGDRINNGVSQLADIEVIIDRALDLEGEAPEQEVAEPTPEELMEAMLEDAQEVAENMKEYMDDQGVEEEIEMKYSLNYVKITLPGETVFDSGDARIKQVAYPIIETIGQMINDEQFEDYTIQIEGHTDNIPISTAYFPSNWELSAARAIAVGTYLIDAFDYDENRISCTGYGEYQPLVDNDTAKNRAKNRRVEVKVVFQSEEVDIEEFTLEEGHEDAFETEGEEAAPTAEDVLDDILEGIEGLEGTDSESAPE